MSENKFFGRLLELELLKKRFDAFLQGYRQNIAIIGDELVGKTTLIYHFLNKFSDNRVLTVYLQVRPETVDSFAKRFIGVLLYNFLINSALPLKEDLNFLIDKSSKYLPQTTEKIRSILSSTSKRKRNNVITELLSLCELIHQETGKRCIVIFDEFHNFESLGINHLYSEWSKLLISQKNTMYIIISSAKYKTHSILSKELSLLFGNFELLEIEPFDVRTSEFYIEHATKPLVLPKGLSSYIIHFTGGYPFYLDLICQELRKEKQCKLTEVLENLLFESSGILNQRFSAYLKLFLDNQSSQQYLSILYLVANSTNKIKDISHMLHKPQKEIIPKINNLLEVDAITRQGDFLRINDRVFAFWLKFVHKEKTNALTFDSKNQKEIFRNYIETGINEFLQNCEKSVKDRIYELLQSFQDETIQIDTRKLRLSQFREIKPLEFNNLALKEGIIGRSVDSLWIIAIKPDMLTEDYVAEFARECRKYRHKDQKKVIVTLRDIDMNARLRAMEEKILTLDLENLNEILDLYSKPWVVV